MSIAPVSGAGERLTTTEAARLLGCHPQHIRALVKAEKLPAERVGLPGRDYLLIPAAAVRAYRPEHPQMGRARHAAPKK